MTRAMAAVQIIQEVATVLYSHDTIIPHNKYAVNSKNRTVVLTRILLIPVGKAWKTAAETSRKRRDLPRNQWKLWKKCAKTDAFGMACVTFVEDK